MKSLITCGIIFINLTKGNIFWCNVVSDALLDLLNQQHNLCISWGNLLFQCKWHVSAMNTVFRHYNCHKLQRNYFSIIIIIIFTGCAHYRVNYYCNVGVSRLYPNVQCSSLQIEAIKSKVVWLNCIRLLLYKCPKQLLDCLSIWTGVICAPEPEDGASDFNGQLM